jgi:mono/diheme cytochrome c family protein
VTARRALGAAVGVGVAAVALAVLVGFGPGRSEAEVVASGRAIYAAQCASCHGAALEGDPDWRTPLADGRLRAPPHDATGHTWHHPDDVLFRITKHGSAAVVGGGYVSDMPRFDGLLTDEEIRDVLAFIRSAWPERERAYQAEVTRRSGG